jgi:hypothetical protein
LLSSWEINSLVLIRDACTWPPNEKNQNDLHSDTVWNTFPHTKNEGTFNLVCSSTFRQDQMLNFGERESYDHTPGFSKRTFEQKSKLHPPWTWAQMVWVQCHFLWQLICSCMLQPPTIFSTIFYI